jgi:hypothetical protein
MTVTTTFCAIGLLSFRGASGTVDSLRVVVITHALRHGRTRLSFSSCGKSLPWDRLFSVSTSFSGDNSRA